MRRMLLGTALGIVAALALGVLASVALVYGWQRDWLRHELEVRLTEALDMPVAIEALDGVLHREATVRGLRIGEAAAPLLVASSLRVQLGALQLARTPVVTLDAIALSNSHLTLRRSAEGTWPWERESADPPDAESAAEEWPVRVRVRSLLVEDLRLDVIREKDVVSIEASGALSAAELRAEPSFEEARLSFSAFSSSAKTGSTENREPWMRGNGRGSYEQGRWQLAELHVEGPVLHVEGHGSGDLRAIATAQLSLSVPSIPAFAERALGEVSSVGGAIDLSATLHGAYAWPQGTVTLDARDLSSDGLELGDVHLEALSPEEGRLRIEALQLARGPFEANAVPGADLTADPGSTRLEALDLRSPDGNGSLRIEASVPRMASASASEIGRNPETRLAVRSTAWPLETLAPIWSQLQPGLDVAGVFDADLVVAGGATGPTVAGEAQLTAGRLVFAPGRAEGVDLALTLRGELAAPQVSLSGRSAQLFVDARALGALDFSARTTGGRTLVLDRLALQGGPVPLHVVPEARLRFEPSGGVAFEALTIEGEAQRIALSGSLSAAKAQALRLELELDMARTAEILRLLGLAPLGTDLSGQLAGHVVWDGPLEQPRLDGDLAWSEARLGGFEFEQIDTKMETSGSEVRITSEWTQKGVAAMNLVATLPRDQILANPRALLRNPRATLRARSDALELAALMQASSSPASAPGGDASVPAPLEVAGVFDADLVVAGGPKGATVEGKLQLAGGRLAFQPGRAEGVDLEVTIHGELERPQISAHGRSAQIFVDAQALGALDFSARTSDGRTVVLDRLALKDGPVSLRVAPEARLRLTPSGVVEFEAFTLESEGQQIALSGGLSSAKAQALRLDLAPLDVARTAEILRLLGLEQVDTDLSGQIAGHVVWEGSLERPRLEADLAWSEARIGEFEFERIDAKMATSESEVRITSEWIQEGVSALHLDATLPRDQILANPRALVSNPRATLEARTDAFELGALAPFLPAQVSGLGGVMTAEVGARGSTPSPAISGRVSIDQGAVKLAALAGQTFEAIRVRLSLTEDRLAIEELQIGAAGSQVRGRGEARLDETGAQSVDLSLDFEAFPIDAPGLVRGTVSGLLRLSGRREDMALTGKLALGELRIQIPESQDAALKEIRVVSSDGEDSDLAIREEDSVASLLDPLRVDLNVSIARNSWARGRGAEVELRGDFEAKKDRGLPLGLSGSVETVRGTYEIYGRRFRIERGTALLDGASEVDPLLDIRALHRVRGVRIFAIVEGRLSEPHLRFDSEPELSETDIASYLLLGRPAGNSGGEQQVALDAAAAQIAAGAALREFEKIFGGALPVDLIDMRVEQQNGKSEIRAGVGKYVGERIFLHYERGFGHVPEDELKAEYELTPSWSVESNVSSEGETGADLIFEIEY